MEIISGLKLSTDQVKTKNFSFSYFCRFVTSALTVRPKKTYIYCFQALFSICYFLAISFGFKNLRVSSFYSILNFLQIEQDYLRVHVLVCCWAAKQYSEISGIFSKLQTEERVLRVNKRKISGKHIFNGEHFGTEGSHG